MENDIIRIFKKRKYNEYLIEKRENLAKVEDKYKDLADEYNTKLLELLKNKNIPYRTYFNIVQKSFIQGNEDIDISTNKIIYHTTSASIESLKKYGLCSPKDLYLKNPTEFSNGTKRRYLGRVAEYLNKPEDEVTDTDILNYLDTYRLPCTSKSCFFSFNKPKPNKIDFITKKQNITFAISIETLKKYAVSNPILSKYLKFTAISWNELNKNISKYEEQAYKDIPNSNGYYRNILHLAVNLNPIPFKDLIPVIDETVGNENMDVFLRKANQLLDHMKTFTYGIYKEHNTWYIQSPENLEKSKLGVCHDFSLYAYYHLTRNGYVEGSENFTTVTNGKINDRELIGMHLKH